MDRRHATEPSDNDDFYDQEVEDGIDSDSIRGMHDKFRNGTKPSKSLSKASKQSPIKKLPTSEQYSNGIVLLHSDTPQNVNSVRSIRIEEDPPTAMSLTPAKRGAGGLKSKQSPLRHSDDLSFIGTTHPDRDFLKNDPESIERDPEADHRYSKEYAEEFEEARSDKGYGDELDPELQHLESSHREEDAPTRNEDSPRQTPHPHPHHKQKRPVGVSESYDLNPGALDQIRERARQRQLSQKLATQSADRAEVAARQQLRRSNEYPAANGRPPRPARAGADILTVAEQDEHQPRRRFNYSPNRPPRRGQSKEKLSVYLNGTAAVFCLHLLKPNL